MAIKKYPLRVQEIKRIKPSNSEPEIIHNAIVPFSGLPQGLPGKLNVRTIDDLGFSTSKTAVYKTVERTVQGKEGKKGKFHLKNNGISLAASSVVKVTNDLYHLYIDEDTEGITNGGHTYELITRNVDAGTAIEALVKVEITEGMDEETKEEVAIGLNSQVNVDQTSIFNTKKVFNSLKDFLAEQKHPYGDKIAYQMNALEPIKVGEVISKLVCLDAIKYPLDREMWIKSKHPVSAYAGKTQTLTLYNTNLEYYEKMFKLLPNILELAEIIQMVVPTEHAKQFKNASNKVEYIDTNNVKTMYILGEESKSNLTDGLVKPLLSGFRSLIDPNTLYWDRSFTEVKKVLKESLPELVMYLKSTANALDNKANSMARDTRLWTDAASTIDKYK